MRDAAVVTASIEAMRRHADGIESVDDLIHRLATLSPEQASSLQLSVESTLLQACITRAADARGPQGAELRRLLAELAGSAPPQRGPGASGTAPASGPVYGPRSAFGPLPRPLGPPPVLQTGALTGLVDDFVPQAVPVPHSLEREMPPMPPPARPPKGAAAGFPRLSPDSAAERRARMVETLSTALPPNTLPPGEDAR